MAMRGEGAQVARVALMLGFGGPFGDRDAFLEAALRAGAAEAVWFEPGGPWAERYSGAVAVATRAAPEADSVSRGVALLSRRYARRQLLWPGEGLLVLAPAGRVTPLRPRVRGRSSRRPP